MLSGYCENFHTDKMTEGERVKRRFDYVQCGVLHVVSLQTYSSRPVPLILYPPNDTCGVKISKQFTLCVEVEVYCVQQLESFYHIRLHRLQIRIVDQLTHNY